jgi:hypothetical protein
MIHDADPPILLRDVLDDEHAAAVLLARAARESDARDVFCRFDVCRRPAPAA